MTTTNSPKEVVRWGPILILAAVLVFTNLIQDDRIADLKDDVQISRKMAETNAAELIRLQNEIRAYELRHGEILGDGK